LARLRRLPGAAASVHQGEASQCRADARILCHQNPIRVVVPARRDACHELSAGGDAVGRQRARRIRAARLRHHLIAPLITGLSIMPFSTPHIVAMVLYSPVCIRCSSALRSDSASPEPLATGQPYGAESNTWPAGTSAPALSLIAKPVTGESAVIASTSPAIKAAVRSSWRS